MGNLGAIGGPLLAIGLVALVGVRAAIGLSVIPGLLAALAIIYAIRNTAAPRQRASQPIRIRVRPVPRGRLGRLMIGVTTFEPGNAAATLLILRATDLFDPGRSQDRRHPVRPGPVRALQPRRDTDQHPDRVARRPAQPPSGPGRRGGLLRRRIRRLRRRAAPALRPGHLVTHPVRAASAGGVSGQLRRQESCWGRLASAALGIFRSITSRATAESLRLWLRA